MRWISQRIPQPQARNPGEVIGIAGSQSLGMNDCGGGDDGIAQAQSLLLAEPDGLHGHGLLKRQNLQRPEQ